MVVGFCEGGRRRDARDRLRRPALVALASLELSLREHFAGYRSHTALLAGARRADRRRAALLHVAAAGGAAWAVAVLVGFLAFRALRAAFERRAEGLSWRA